MEIVSLWHACVDAWIFIAWKRITKANKLIGALPRPTDEVCWLNVFRKKILNLKQIFSFFFEAHVRTNSTGSIGLMMHPQQQQRNDCQQRTTKEEMKCTLRGVRLAHQQPITCMEVVNDMVFTGSQDHTLKVIFIPFFFLVVNNYKFILLISFSFL